MSAIRTWQSRARACLTTAAPRSHPAIRTTARRFTVGVRRHRLHPPGHEVPKESWGYSGVEKNEQDALSRLTGLYQAIARTPAWAGLCYTQLTDVEQEINGLMTYDRKPKST